MPSSATPARAHPSLALGIRALLVALAMIAVALIVATPPAHADDTVGISARPADAEGTVDGRTRFSYRVDPGQQLADHLLVQNTGSTAQQFTIAGTDAYNGDDGDFAVLPTAQEPTRIGAWMRFDNGSNRIDFTLEPGQSRLLPFSLSLPAEATPGDHVGGIVASVVTPGEQVTLDRRVATRVYARVSGQLQPGLAVAGIDASYHGDWWNPLTGTVRLNYTVENAGNIALAANYSAGVATWFGMTAAEPTTGQIPELLPGNTQTFEASVPAVASWLYLQPWIELSPFVDTTDPSLNMPVSPVSRDAILLAPPWVLVIALAVIAGIVVLRRWRRKADAQRAAEWIAYTEAKATRKAEASLASDAGLIGTGGAER